MTLEKIIENFIEEKSKTDVDFKNNVEMYGKNIVIDVAHKCTEHARKLASGKGCYGVDDKTLYSWIFEAIMDGEIGDTVQDVNVDLKIEDNENQEDDSFEEEKPKKEPKPKKAKKKEQANDNQMSLFDFIN